MKLYKWDSDFLADYSSGDIITMAESVGEARERAREGFITWITEWRTWLLDAENKEEYEQQKAVFEEDIKAGPEEIDTGSVFIRGSA